jgi:ABC-2 type transport system permease protein
VLGQSLRLALRSVGGWAAGLGSLCLLYVTMWPSISGNASYADIIRNLPEAYRSLIESSGMGDLTSASGYLNAEVFSLTGPLLVIVHAIIAGSGAVAGMERRGVLEPLLAQPLSRTRWIVEQAGSVGLQIVAATGAGCAVLVLSRPLGDLDVRADRILAACVHLAVLGLTYGALALAIGAATGRPTFTRASAPWPAWPDT